MDIADYNQALQSPLLGAETSGGGEERTPPAAAAPSRSSVRLANSLVSTTATQTTRHSFLVGSGTVSPEASDDEGAGCGTKLCRAMDKFPITFVLGGAAIGLAIGLGLAFWEPANPDTKDVVVQWLGLFGDLFIRALKCIVLPLVFVSIAISMMDMLSLGEAGTIVGVTIGLYLLTTVCASLIGVASSVIFSNFYALQNGLLEGVDPLVRLGCSYDEDTGTASYLTKSGVDGSVACSVTENVNDDDVMFMMDDVNGYFSKSALAEGPAQLSLSDSIYEVSRRLLLRAIALQS